VLCTRCSAVVKPLVAVDIDGTLGDYHGHFLNFAGDYLGPGVWIPCHSLAYDGSVGFKEWFMHHTSTDERTWNDIKLAYRQGGMKRSMPRLKGAEEFVSLLHEEGCEVWLTTTRPYLRLDGIDPDTRHWLHRNNISYDGLLYDEDKYHVLRERVDPKRVVMVLDDLPEQYDAAAVAFGATVPVLRRNGYNFGVSRPATAQTLEEAAHLFVKRLEHWRERNG
jgi:hypothetical protein